MTQQTKNMDYELKNEIFRAGCDIRDYRLDNDLRLVDPIFGSKYDYYTGESFDQIRCGPDLHLAIHDKGTDTSTGTDTGTPYSFSCEISPETVNEKDEFGNTALHVVAIVAYNTGKYIEMKNIILFLQSVGIKQKFCVNKDGDTAVDLFDRMIEKAEEDGDDPYGKSYDLRMFRSHAYELSKLRDLL